MNAKVDLGNEGVYGSVLRKRRNHIAQANAPA
jgi:hypothetical protein